MANGLDLYSTFIQSTGQVTHPFTHQQRLAAKQGTNQLVRSNWGFSTLLRDTSTHPGQDRTGNPLTTDKYQGRNTVSHTGTNLYSLASLTQGLEQAVTTQCSRPSIVCHSLASSGELYYTVQGDGEGRRI